MSNEKILVEKEENKYTLKRLAIAEKQIVDEINKKNEELKELHQKFQQVAISLAGVKSSITTCNKLLGIDNENIDLAKIQLPEEIKQQNPKIVEPKLVEGKKEEEKANTVETDKPI